MEFGVPIDDDIIRLFKKWDTITAFCSSISLNRLNFLVPILQYFDWPLSWHALRFDEYNQSLHTFKSDHFHSFREKLWADELPVLAVLQIRNPTIYHTSWNCPHCLLYKETLSHLWTCSPIHDASAWSHLDALRDILDKSLLLARKISRLTKDTVSVYNILLALNSLPCLTFPASPISLHPRDPSLGPSLLDLLRGYIPLQLVDCLASASLLSNKLLYSALIKFVFFLQ